jgi:hypothetical protein
VLFGVFNFSDLADGLPGLPVTMDCSVEIDGSLVVNGNSMKGTYTEFDDCNGVRLATLTGTLTMQKQ